MLILSRPRSSAKSGWSQSIGRIASGLACGRMNGLPPVTSSSTILVTVTSPIRHFITASLQCAVHGLENRHQRRVGSSLSLEGFLMGGDKMAGLDTILETTPAERPATGFVFTEGPLWHPDGYYYFADVRSSVFYRLRLGQAPETVRTATGEGNGTTFDLQGRVIICEGGNRRVTRWSDDRHRETLMDRYEGKRINRPNDVVCKSDGSIWFTDPGLRVPLADKELPHSGVYAVRPDGTSRLVAEFEYPNGLAFSPDERTLYVANTRHAQYIHAVELDSTGNMVRRRIFADMSSERPMAFPTV